MLLANRHRTRLAGPAALAAALALPASAMAENGAAAGFDLMDLAFWALAAVTLISGAGVAFSRNILYSSFSLLGAFLGVAGLYVMLSADFLAVSQILIYVGGVLVLILFAVMLTAHIGDVRVSNASIGLLPATLASLATTALLVFVSVAAPWSAAGPNPAEPTTAKLGDLFLNRYLLPFEIASVVLLATLIGAVVVARKEIKPD